MGASGSKKISNRDVSVQRKRLNENSQSLNKGKNDCLINIKNINYNLGSEEQIEEIYLDEGVESIPMAPKKNKLDTPKTKVLTKKNISSNKTHYKRDKSKEIEKIKVNNKSNNNALHFRSLEINKNNNINGNLIEVQNS